MLGADFGVVEKSELDSCLHPVKHVPARTGSRIVPIAMCLMVTSLSAVDYMMQAPPASVHARGEPRSSFRTSRQGLASRARLFSRGVRLSMRNPQNVHDSCGAWIEESDAGRRRENRARTRSRVEHDLDRSGTTRRDSFQGYRPSNSSLTSSSSSWMRRSISSSLWRRERSRVSTESNSAWKSLQALISPRRCSARDRAC